MLDRSPQYCRSRRRVLAAGIALAAAAITMAATACSADRGSGGAAGSGPAGAGSGGGAPGKGVTSSAISIGVVYLTNAQLGGGSSVDQKAQAQAVVDYVNSHGKVAGRTIKPVYHPIDEKLAAGGSNEDSKACAALTEDATVFAVVAQSSIDDDCLVAHQTPIIASLLGASSSSYQSNGKYLYAPSDLPSDQQYNVLAAGLVQQGFFTKMPAGAAGPAKIGVVTFAASKPSIAPDLQAALAAQHLKVADWGLIQQPGKDDSGIVLRFKSEHITHVLFPGYSPLAFAPAAQTQHYDPLYGLDSRNSPGLIEKMAPAAQLRSAYAVGWQPYADVDAQQPTGLTGPNAQLCTKIMQAAHLPVDPLSMSSAVAYCDDFMVLQKSLAHAGTVNLQTLQQGYEAIGNWDSPAVPAAFLGPDHHAGASGYRDVRFSAGCKCFTYAGPVHSLPAS